MAPKNSLEKRRKYQIISNNVLFTSIKMSSKPEKQSIETEYRGNIFILN